MARGVARQGQGKGKKRGNKRASHLTDYAGPKADKATLAKREAKAAKANRKVIGIGHNSGVANEDMIRHHASKIIEARNDWKKARDLASKAQGVLRNCLKVAKSDGIDKDALNEVLDEMQRATAEVAAEYRNKAHYARVLGAPIADPQLGLFDFLDKGPPPGEPKLAGERAGYAGAPMEDNPHIPGSVEYQLWADGYIDGIGKRKIEPTTKTANGEAVAA